MEYFLGLLTAVVFILVFFVGFYIGSKKTAKQLKPPEIQKPTEVDATKEREIKQLQDDFKKLMSYDVNMARERKKV